MRWQHPDFPGRNVRLAYCLNLHAADTLAELVSGLRRVTRPLHERLAPGREFGVGLWFPAPLARELLAPAGRNSLELLCQVIAEDGLDPFTFNAFPYDGFQRNGLKADVYRPSWWEAERARFTLDVAQLAVRLQPRQNGHISISTHPGSYGAWMNTMEQHRAAALQLASVVRALARHESESGKRIVLSLEAEPLASAGDSRELAGFLAYARAEIAAELARERGTTLARGGELAQRHLGTCLDACHAAVEFEAPSEAVQRSTYGGPLGKLQFSSALALVEPARSPQGRALLLALAEPRFLHQVVGHGSEGLLHAADLPDLSRALSETTSPWLACKEWRCHFHVPVDLAGLEGLGTTRAQADATLGLLLAAPNSWSTTELHVEIETYTWDVLPRGARGSGELVDGLEREYRHVMAQLLSHGWSLS